MTIHHPFTSFGVLWSLIALGVCACDPAARSGEEPNATSRPAADAHSSSNSLPDGRVTIVVPGEFVVPARRDAAALPAGLIAVEDLDGDGAMDLIACLETPAAGADSRRRITAFSGADGRVLWGADAPLSAPKKNGDTEDKAGESPAPSIDIDGLRPLPDMNGDGVGDVFVGRRGEQHGFAVLSGRNGRVIAVNASPKDDIDQLVDARDVDGDAQPDLVFAVRIRDDAANQPADRLCFAVYSGVHFRRVVSYKKPFNRLGVRQALLFGGFPDTNADGVPEILCFGESPPFRDRPQEGNFALVVGQLLKRWVLTRAGFDPTATSSFIACPGIVVPDSFTDLVISTPAGDGQPSQLGLYVLKQQKFAWKLTGRDAAQAIEKLKARTAHEEAGFGAPIIPVPDQDGDGLNDVATICRGPAPDAGLLSIVSSQNGRVLTVLAAPEPDRIDPRVDHVQLALLKSNDEAMVDRVAVTGSTADGNGRRPAILLFRLGSPGAISNRAASTP